MTSVRIYTKQHCSFSQRARLFLEENGIPYEDVDITGDPQLREEMVKAAGGASTTPQIFIGGEHIGGLDDLLQEDRQGRLAAMLSNDLAPASGP
jgi:glutaredoxin 3